MKGKINKMGCLRIDRAGKSTPQWCPRTGGDDQPTCGDWCPLFGEPEAELELNECPVDNSGTAQISSYYSATGRTLLQLCKRTLTFDEFEDERGKQA